MPGGMSDYIVSEIAEAETVHGNLSGLVPAIETSGKLLLDAYRNGHKMVIFGNGGSAADAQHIAAELVGKFQLQRKALPALALTVNTSILTAVANDYSYDDVFARQLEGQCTAGDVAVGISTSGRSVNVIRALERARQMGMGTIGLTGQNGFPEGLADVQIRVPSGSTQRIQECHILVGHILSGIVESGLFS